METISSTLVGVDTEENSKYIQTVLKVFHPKEPLSSDNSETELLSARFRKSVLELLRLI